ncbi:MAG: ABC transporter ATP-binding protein [Anaerolineales bacterium]|nr:ABC transporter ATP-binding protein [Anaerolineales bacterium]
MLRLIRYLKPYFWLFVIAVVLLFGQANADLALPDYMSRIVNNGIQQSGIEKAVPEAMRASTLDKLNLFLSEDETRLVEENYTLVEKDSPDYQDYVERYPILAEEPVYVLNQIDQETSDQLNAGLAQDLIIVSLLTRITEDPAALEQMQTLAPEMAEGFGQLPPGMDIFQALAIMPEAQLAQLTAGFDQQFASLDANMLTQIGIEAVKAEYEAIGMDLEKLRSSYILRTGAIMLLISLAGGAATIAVSYLGARVAAGVARDLRRDLFAHVESFSAAEFNKFSTASLITRSTNDITQVQTVTFMVMRMVIYAPILGVGAVIRAMGKGAEMSWIIAAAVMAILTLIAIVFVISLPKFKIIQDLIDRLNLVTRENLSGMMVIRAFNKQAFEEDRFDKANLDLTRVSLFVTRVMVTLMPVMMLVMNGLTVLILWVGAHQVAEANMQVGDMMAFLQYAMQIVFSFLMMTMMFIFLPRASISGARIADVLETEVEIKDPKEPKQFAAPFKGEIEFRDVGFKYPGAEDYVVCDLNFTAQPGKTTAIIGSTGCGKSTVINLIPRFYDVSSGAILIDGIDIRQVKQSDLRAKIGYVPQRGVLFSGTIESNLRYADEEAPEEDLIEAVEIAQAGEFVFGGEKGLQAEISQGGANVSGGQKQRLAIARALVKRPPIFIFDDSFSALDFKTDATLRKTLKEKTGNSTVLIVTQRVATVKNADQILVLDEGRIVGKGRHQDLMKTCSTYQEIARSQLSEEELS